MLRIVTHPDLAPTAATPLDERVSTLLERDPGVLTTLLAFGFAPLANPLTRAVLAPTVTLRQALRLRGLDDADTQRLLTALAGLEVDAPCPT